MLIEGAGVILSEYCHALNMGIAHVAERKIDASVASCNRHCGDRPFIGQFSHSLAVSAC